MIIVSSSISQAIQDTIDLLILQKYHHLQHLHAYLTLWHTKSDIYWDTSGERNPAMRRFGYILNISIDARMTVRQMTRSSSNKETHDMLAFFDDLLQSTNLISQHTYTFRPNDAVFVKPNFRNALVGGRARVL